MKTIILLAGLAGLLWTTGCETEHHHRHHAYGGAYDRDNYQYGSGTWDSHHRDGRYDRDDWRYRNDRWR